MSEWTELVERLMVPYRDVISVQRAQRRAWAFQSLATQRRKAERCARKGMKLATEMRAQEERSWL